MLTLNPDESRVLGVLIEKSTTTPEQYPLTLNAVTNGSNQKNNRDPVRTMTEDECFEAVEQLRAKGLVVRVDQMGSRVPKFRHHGGEVFKARTGELAVLAELLLPGTADGRRAADAGVADVADGVAGRDAGIAGGAGRPAGANGA